MITDEQREFWATKNPAKEFDVIVFEHIEFKEPVRLVLNEQRSIELNGFEFIPVAAELTKPEQGRDPISSVRLKLSRIHVGDRLKEIISSISSRGWASPITMIVQQYNELDLTTPSQNWRLYVSEDGLRFNRNSVEITATDDNPMSLDVSTIYTIEEYPGLSRT